MHNHMLPAEPYKAESEGEEMTIGGALNALNDLLNADDIPFFYKPAIKAVMETIKAEKCECEKDVHVIDLTALLNQLEKTGAANIEVIFTKSEYPGREIYYGIREKRDDEQGEDREDPRHSEKRKCL